MESLHIENKSKHKQSGHDIKSSMARSDASFVESGRHQSLLDLDLDPLGLGITIEGKKELSHD